MLKTDPTLLGPAVHAMEEGVGIFDPDDLLVACNARYVLVQQSFGANVRLGMSWEDLVASGLHQRKIPEAQGHEDTWLVQRRQLHGFYSAIVHGPDGHVYKVNERRMAGGGFVSVWTDVTELVLGEQTGFALPADSAATLTDRQREIIQLLVSGFSMKAVGRMLGIAPRTVAFHKYHAMAANGLSSNSDLLRFAIGQGLLSQAVKPQAGNPGLKAPGSGPPASVCRA